MSSAADYDVAIVGAGAAGMLAARELARAGLRVALLEAQDRFGGRMRAAYDPRAHAPIELGAEFVHGTPEITYRLLHEAGTTVVVDDDTGFEYRDGALRPATTDRFEAASRLLVKALEREGDESVDTLLERVSVDDRSREDASWARRMVAGFDAADTSLASARAVANEWSGDAAAGGAQSRPLGGYAALVAHLARSLDPATVDVRMRAIVTHVAYGTDGVRVAWSERGETHELAARHAIVTVPAGVLRASAGELGAIAFDPPLPRATLAAIERTAMGPVVKVVLAFESPFWESLHGGAYRDAAFIGGDELFPTLWTQVPVRAATLVAWAGGNAADRFAGVDEERRAEIALECAGRYLGDPAAVRAAFRAAHQHDWQRDPFARGAYSYLMVGGEGARETLATPVDDVLHFAGEATASDAEGGTVAGALQSGSRAARRIIDAGARRGIRR